VACPGHPNKRHEMAMNIVFNMLDVNYGYAGFAEKSGVTAEEFGGSMFG
jgi:hypothetical protein